MAAECSTLTVGGGEVGLPRPTMPGQPTGRRRTLGEFYSSGLSLVPGPTPIDLQAQPLALRTRQQHSAADQEFRDRRSWAFERQ